MIVGKGLKIVMIGGKRVDNCHDWQEKGLGTSQRCVIELLDFSNLVTFVRVFILRGPTPSKN